MGIVSLIVAASQRTNAIGHNGDLPWSRRLPADMQHFVGKTSGHPVIMGRKTWESIPPKFRPLDRNRTNIILSTTMGDPNLPMTHVVGTFEEALCLATQSPGNDEIFVAGGAQMYELALQYAQRIYKTLVDEDPEADTFFPEHPDIMREVSRHVVPATDTCPRLTMVTYTR